MATNSLRVTRPATYFPFGGPKDGRPNMWPSSDGQDIGVNNNVNGDANKMTIKPVGQEGGLTIPYAPRQVTLSDQAGSWAAVNRTGQTPLAVRESLNLNKMGFTLFFGSTDSDKSCAAAIRKLESYAELDTPLRIKYSSMEEGEWHISSMSTTTINKRPADHETTQANVEIEFVRSTGGADGIGPVTGGKGAGKSKDENGHTVEYKVKQGDTLHSIANKFFKDTSRWKDIAKWNDIKDPKKLKVGQILKIKLPGKSKGKGK